MDTDRNTRLGAVALTPLVEDPVECREAVLGSGILAKFGDGLAGEPCRLVYRHVMPVGGVEAQAHHAALDVHGPISLGRSAPHGAWHNGGLGWAPS